METVATLTARHAQAGRVTWIGVRPARHAEVRALDAAAVNEGGLEGDHRSRPGKRAITLIQAEHLAVIAALLGRNAVAPELLRRNIVVGGINLLGLRNRRFRIGSAVLEGSGLCAPCSRMETALGHGGYTAVRGHGGITASVVLAGQVALGDSVAPIEESAG
ncbi:MAG: MOSC domain-containing protein [Pseudomonadota bacterium]